MRGRFWPINIGEWIEWIAHYVPLCAFWIVVILLLPYILALLPILLLVYLTAGRK